MQVIPLRKKTKQNKQQKNIDNKCVCIKIFLKATYENSYMKYSRNTYANSHKKGVLKCEGTYMILIKTPLFVEILLKR